MSIPAREALESALDEYPGTIITVSHDRFFLDRLATQMLSFESDGSILDYCRLNDITIQPWSPFQYGFFEGVFLDNDKFPELNLKINEMAAAKGIANTAIAIAWLLRHPAKMQPIVGTTNAQRVQDLSKASDITLSRQEWYQVYLAAGNKLP